MIQAFSAYSSAAGSTRVRLTDWFAFLGLRPTHHSFAGTSDNRPRTLLRNARAGFVAHRRLSRINVAGDTVIISREASPLSRGGTEERILREARHSVYDFDDALFVKTSAARSLVAGTDKCRRSCNAADTVVVGNEFLADWATNHGQDVRLIPSCIDPDSYRARDKIPPVQNPPRLVWIGSRSTEKHLGSILPALRVLHHETGVRLTVISAPGPSKSLDSEEYVDRIPWDSVDFAQQLTQADIGLAPLPDTPFNRGKCAYKLLQYAATGLPVVGSPVGANAVALDRFQGHAATSLDDWVNGLRDLIGESEKDRCRRSAASLAGVRRHYSFQAWESDWVNVLGASALLDVS